MTNPTPSKAAAKRGATAETWSPETDPDVIARRLETRIEYGQWVAAQDIYVGTALAYREGDPVPDSNVQLHGYDQADLVTRVATADELAGSTVKGK